VEWRTERRVGHDTKKSGGRYHHVWLDAKFVASGGFESGESAGSTAISIAAAGGEIT
jgi:hypothetical protein